MYVRHACVRACMHVLHVQGLAYLHTLSLRSMLVSLHGTAQLLVLAPPGVAVLCV